MRDVNMNTRRVLPSDYDVGFSTKIDKIRRWSKLFSEQPRTLHLIEDNVDEASVLCAIQNKHSDLKHILK